MSRPPAASGNRRKRGAKPEPELELVAGEAAAAKAEANQPDQSPQATATGSADQQRSAMRTGDLDLRETSARFMVSPTLIREAPSAGARVIVELNIDFPGGLDKARDEAIGELEDLELDAEAIEQAKAKRSRYNIFTTLDGAQLTRLNARALEDRPYPIFKIWRDEKLDTCIHRSLPTIKGDACQVAFNADGRDIVVAVADSGIDRTHAHFAKLRNLGDLPLGVEHRDFTVRLPKDEQPFNDTLGHGTHVAGIIAGVTVARDSKNPAKADLPPVMALTYHQGDDSGPSKIPTIRELEGVVLSGIAPRAKLLSLKVITGKGDSLDLTSNLIVALEYVESLNHPGKLMKVHVVNLSLGYRFDAMWYAAGHSPLCVAVKRLVRTGVVVVAAAGNDGSIELFPNGERKRIGLDQSITDPGNTEEAITVGATHGDEPHRYGVSYFSSRGPTADGRAKPDLVAPGERILSAASHQSEDLMRARQSITSQALDVQQETPDSAAAVEPIYFEERTGTSMAAPHVAGAVAALLSVRREFIEEPLRVKRILIDSCTDLGRKHDFQGAGLLDLARAIQSV